MSHGKVRSSWRCRAGASRLDVIVVGGLVLMFVLGLGIWASQPRIHAARRMQCKNNLKQWGVALRLALEALRTMHDEVASYGFWGESGTIAGEPSAISF
jgi:hypothetical protein